MTLEEYAKFVQSETRQMIAHKLSAVEIDVLALSNALGGEVGELQNVVKKIISKNVFLIQSDLHENFVEEAGDVFWYLFRLILQSGYNIETVLEENKKKLELQYKSGEDKWRK